jgi:hypothetical protein
MLHCSVSYCVVPGALRAFRNGQTGRSDMGIDGRCRSETAVSLA